MNVQIMAFLRENALFMIVLVSIIAAFVLLRTKGTSMSSLDEFDALINADQPVVVEFYSNT